MSDNIYLRCSVIVLLCATTFAAPGGFGSFAGSSSSAFSSATSNAQAGSVASAISSAFSGSIFPSNNPDGLNHLQGISVGTGSFAGTGNIHPGSDKFGLSHQISSGIKGGHNNHKSQSPCSQCAHNKEKLDYDNYDEQPEEKDEETHGEEDDCDDGQYRPEHHYKHDKSGDGKDNEEETVPGVHKIGNTDTYDYDQENDKGSYTPSGNKGQGNNNYGNTGLTGANNQNLNNNNYGDNQHSTKYPFAHTNAGTSKDFSHLSINPSDFNKKKENDNKNLGTPGIVAPTSGVGSNYGNTNKGPFGNKTPSQTNLGSVSGTNVGCSKTGSGGGCSTSETDLNQGPVKIGQTDLTQATNAPSFTTGGNKATAGCNSLYGNCGNGKTDGTGQYQSTSVGSGQNLQNGYTGGVSGGNKPQSQTYGVGGSGPGHVGIGSTPFPTQTHGTFGSGSGNIGFGNKPNLYDQQHTGQPNNGKLPSGSSGTFGAGSGSKPGASSAPCDDDGTPLQKNVPISSEAFGTASSGIGFNANGQSGFGSQNSYQFNTGNPFLHGGQINSKPNIYPTSSPFSNSLSTTVKPIGHGNPFLDGTITHTFGSQHGNNDKNTLGVIPIKNNDVPNKPIGVGNPFLSNGSGGSSSFGTGIHPGINIGNISPSTVKPIGQNNPFFGTSSGNSVNKYPSGVDSNKNTPFGSGTSNPSSSNDQNSNVQFPKSKEISGIPGVIGISSSGTYSNTNQGVKGGQHHNPTLGSVATSNAGAFSSGFNTPNAYNNNNNNNNAGHGTGSLIGTANIKKPSYTLLNSPDTSSQTNGNGNSLSNSLNNGNNPNGQFNNQIANAGAQSFAGASAGASAGSYAGSFSSSQASSSSSSFASSKSGSYSVNGDPNIFHQLDGNWPPFNVARSLDGTNSGWPSLNAGSQASAFASSSAGSWSGPQPFGVKSR
ncbi:PREDICTED: hornerin-like [Polistes canadensis]|uniref:hornerin-like n=1 Tax=Polistes canadensis TaxID=91411 RepID=UPI000718CA8F|nr:PREDICTED: hornerin-like [Polistes canadensis]